MDEQQRKRNGRWSINGSQAQGNSLANGLLCNPKRWQPLSPNHLFAQPLSPSWEHGANWIFFWEMSWQPKRETSAKIPQQRWPLLPAIPWVMGLLIHPTCRFAWRIQSTVEIKKVLLAVQQASNPQGTHHSDGLGRMKALVRNNLTPTFVFNS